MSEEELVLLIRQEIMETKEYISFNKYYNKYHKFMSDTKDEYYELQKLMTKNVLNDSYFQYKQKYIEVKQIMESDPIFIEYNTRIKELNDLFQDILQVLKIRR
jgi:hypothetical protein